MPRSERRAEQQDAVLTVDRVRMRFGDNDVLKDVTLSLRRGEVFGLLGQNGSGKSTLIKVLAGFYQPEPGSEIVLWGHNMPLPLDPTNIKRRGVAFVHQHLGLVPSLTVTENMRVAALGHRRPWFVSWRGEAARVAALFAEFGLDIDPSATVASLAPVERAFVAIVRAFADLRASEAGHAGEGILILDEPTPFLPGGDVDRLFALLRGIVKTGTSVIIVTHDIDEVRAITDRVAVLRDGELVQILDTRASSRQEILDTILGSRAEGYAKARRVALSAMPAVVVNDLKIGTAAPFNLALCPGETLGVTGLIGSGFAMVPYVLFGAQPAEGSIRIGEEEAALGTMRPRVAQAMGMAFLPGDRLGAGGCGSLSVADNMTLPVLEAFRTPLSLDRASMLRDSWDLSVAYDVRPLGPDLALGNLSGGNQQKVLLAKCLQTRPRLLLLDEPTQGVDFGARQHIFETLDRAATAGTSILCASTDNEQLAQICDRVLVFSRGRPVIELQGDQLTKEAISQASFNSASLTGAHMEVAE